MLIKVVFVYYLYPYFNIFIHKNRYKYIKKQKKSKTKSQKKAKNKKRTKNQKSKNKKIKKTKKGEITNYLQKKINKKKHQQKH